MTARPSVIVTAVLLTLPLPAIAAPLTLDAVLRQVDRRLPLLRAAELESDFARTDLLSAQGGFDIAWRTRAVATPFGYYRNGRVDSLLEQPTTLWGTTFFGGYRIGQGAFAEYDGKLATNDLGEWRAGVTVPLWRNGPIDRRRAAITRSEIGLDIASLTVQQQRLELARTAAHRYWDWVAAGRRLAIATDLLALAERRDRDLGAAVKAGHIPAIERVENARSLAQRQSQRVSTQRGLQQATIELSLYVRQPDGAPILNDPAQLPPALPEPAALPANRLQQDQEQAQAQRPEVRRLQAQIRQARIERDWAANQTAPGLDFTVAASQDFGAGSATRQPTELEASLLVDVPLQTRVATGRLENSQALVARLEAQAQFASERIRADVQDAHSALTAARERNHIARQEVALARQVAAAERTKFDLGESSLFIVNLREQAAFEAAIREVDALLDFHKAMAAYWAALGTDAAAAAASGG